MRVMKHCTYSICLENKNNVKMEESWSFVPLFNKGTETGHVWKDEDPTDSF